MSKEKVQKLQKYVDEMKSKLSGEVPPKHQHAPESYRNFLTKEINMASKKLEALKLAATEGKK